MTPTKTHRYRLLRTSLMAVLATAGTAQAQDIGHASTLERLEARIAQLEAQQPAPHHLQASWQNGMRLQSADGAIRLQLGGRVQNDVAILSGDQDLIDEIGPLRDGSKFRRARIYFSGTLYDYTHFRVEYDFAGGNANFRDAYIGVTQVPYLGTIRAGRMLETYSLEQLSGNTFHTFTERGLTAAFNEYWGNGITVQNSVLDQRGTWAIGLLRRTSPFGDSTTNSKHSVSARITAAPVYSEDGRTWMHLGAGYIQRAPNDDTYRISSRPESSVAPFLIRSGDIPADRVDLMGLEFAAAHGPFSLQAEYHNANVSLVETEDFPHRGDANLSGYYVFASYFLTGEHRVYNRRTGTMGRVSPRSNFRKDGHGWGAWEIAVRHSQLDLDDGPVDGGKLTDLTFGVNWYLNPNIRVMANYVNADLDGVGTADIYTMRFQFDF